MKSAPPRLTESGRAAFEMVLGGVYDRLNLFAASGLYFGVSSLGWFTEVVALAMLFPATLACLCEQSYALPLACLGVGVPLFWAQFWWAPRRWNSCSLRDPAWYGVRQVRVTYQSLYFATQARQSEWNWRHFIHWKEGDFCFLLVLPDGTFEYFPKSMFRPRADLAAFCDVLISKIEIRAYDVFPGSVLNKLKLKVLGPNWDGGD